MTGERSRASQTGLWRFWQSATSPARPEPESTLSIEVPLEGFTEATLANLERLIAAKATLIKKKAIGTKTLPVDRIETPLRFPWFSAEATPDEVQAYTVFISRLCAVAKEQMRVTAVERAVVNEKYAFRCFLLKLGLIGDEYKAASKILLSRLEGNGAFRVAGK